MNNKSERLRFDITKLANGHVLYTQPNDLPVTFARLYIPVGSAHSNTKNKDCVGGCFHYLEHMCFERSEQNANKALYMELLSSAGAIQNAWTDAFYTVFSLESPAHTFTIIFPAFINKIVSPSFLVDDIEIQKNIIINERNQRKYFPGDDALSHYCMTSWMNASYYSKEQLFGNDEDLASLTQKNLQSIHKNYFKQPIHIFVSGNFDLEQLVDQLNSLPEPTESAPLVPILNSPSWVNQKYHTYICDDIDKPVYFLGSIYNNFTLKDLWAAEFIHQMLTHTEFGTLQQWIRKEKGWSYGLELHVECEKDRVIWTIKIPLESKEVAEIIHSEIQEKILKTVQNKSLIDATRDRILLQMCFDLETIASRLDSAIWMFNLAGKVVTESEYKNWLTNTLNADYLLEMYQCHFAAEKTGEFLALPKEEN